MHRVDPIASTLPWQGHPPPRLLRGGVVLSALCILGVLLPLPFLPGGPAPLVQAQVLRYVDDDAGCDGHAPCYASIQAATVAAGG